LFGNKKFDWEQVPRWKNEPKNGRGMMARPGWQDNCITLKTLVKKLGGVGPTDEWEEVAAL